MEKNVKIEKFEIENIRRSVYLEKTEKRKYKVFDMQNNDILGNTSESILESKSNFNQVIPIVETNIMEGLNISEAKIAKATENRISQLSKRSGLKVGNYF